MSHNYVKETIEDGLRNLFNEVDKLSNLLIPFEEHFQNCGMKPLEECSIKDKINQAKAVIKIIEANE